MGKRNRRPSARVMKYSYLVMNTDITRREAAQIAGFSQSLADNPKRIEQTKGYKKAQGQLLLEIGAVSMAVLREFETRDLTKARTDELVKFFDVFTKSFERLLPKEQKAVENKGVLDVFARVLDTESKPVETVETVEKTEKPTESGE